MEHNKGQRDGHKGKSNERSSPDDCFSCRLIGSGGVAAIGVYVAYQTKKAYDHNLVHNRQWMKSKVVAGVTFASLSFTIAYMRYHNIFIPWISDE